MPQKAKNPQLCPGLSSLPYPKGTEVSSQRYLSVPHNSCRSPSDDTSFKIPSQSLRMPRKTLTYPLFLKLLFTSY